MMNILCILRDSSGWCFIISNFKIGYLRNLYHLQNSLQLLIIVIIKIWKILFHQSNNNLNIPSLNCLKYGNIILMV